LCWFIPREEGGFLHYSTYRNLKRKNPDKLKELIQTYIISPKVPKRFPPTHRSTIIEEQIQKKVPEDLYQEGSRIEQLLEKTCQSIEMMANILKSLHEPAFSEEKKPTSISDTYTDQVLRTIQNQLIKQIRQKQVDFELWDTYVNLVSSLPG